MTMPFTRHVRLLTIVALGVLGAAGLTIAQQRTPPAMATRASAFLASLTPEQRAKATFSIQSDEWTRWNFIPINTFPRNGLPLADMTPEQKVAAHALLAASLSQAGYLTATSVMNLENFLRDIEARERASGQATGRGGAPPTVWVRDPSMYYFSVFGDPSARGAWGFRVEGHHISLHFAVDNGKLTMATTPQFFGANPAELREGPQTGLRVLAAQEDAGRALLTSLDAAQRAKAIATTMPRGDIVSGTSVRVTPPAPAGLAAADMRPDQRALLMQLIAVYNDIMPADVAADRMAKINSAGVEKIAFAWSGSTEKGQRYQYQVQGPTFLIEHNNTQNNGNHIHSVWRDFNGDFGRDILAEHLAMFAH